jgi:hypothetical protein
MYHAQVESNCLACAVALFVIPAIIGSVTVCAVLKDGVYFTTEGSNGLKALAKQLRDTEAAYETKQVCVGAVCMQFPPPPCARLSHCDPLLVSSRADLLL